MSITYMNLNGEDVAPYKVNSFTWSKMTTDVIVNITISSSYIGAETDLTSELELGQFNKDPNQNYFMPKLCFSITYDGRIYPNREKLLWFKDIKNATNDHKLCDREPYQWEFDRQAERDDLADYGCIKSINTVVWKNADRLIRETLRENEHIKDRAEFLARQALQIS